MTLTRDAALLTLLRFAAFAGPVVAIMAPLGMAPLGILFTLGVLALRWPQRRWWVPLAFAAALGGLGLLGALWALDPAQTIRTSLRLAATVAGGSLAVAALAGADPKLADRLLLPLALGLALAVGVVLFDAVTGHYGSYLVSSLTNPDANRPFKSRFNRGATMVGLLIWPLALMLWRRFGPFPALLAVAAVTAVMVVSDSGSAKLAQLAGIGAAVAVWLAPRWGFNALKGLLVVAALAMPVVFTNIPPPQQTFQDWTWLPGSWHHRVTIWNFTAGKVWEKPLLGWGMDGARTIPGADDEVQVTRRDAQGREIGGMIESMLPLHPHNAILQWWLELGAVGVALMVAFQLWLLGRLQGLQDRAARAAAAAMWTTACVISVVSYGFWQSWWQGGIWFAAAFAALLAGGVAGKRS